MSIDLRLASILPSSFFTEHPELEALRFANPESGYDINFDNNSELGDASLRSQSGNIPINEIEYVIFLQRMQELSNSNSPAATAATELLGSNFEDIVRRFLSDKRAGRLGNITAEAQRLEQGFNQAVENISLSLHTYQNLPRTFQDHIAPNYFRDLAKTATYDSNGDGEVTIPEAVSMIQREVEDQRRAAEPRIQMIFNQTDSDGDHSISLDEFRTANHIEGNDPAVAQRIQEVYNTRFDTDHNNGISLEEFKNAQLPTVTDADYRRLAQRQILQANNELSSAQSRFRPTVANDFELDRLSSRLSSFDLRYLNAGQIPTAVLQENNLFRILTWMRSQCPEGQVLITSSRVDELLQAHVLDVQPIIQTLTALKGIVERPEANIPEQQRSSDVQVILAFIQRFSSVSNHGLITEEVLRDQILGSSSLSLESLNNAVSHLTAQLTLAGLPPPMIERITNSVQEALAPLSRMAGSDNNLSREDLTRLKERDRLRIVLRSLPNNPELSDQKISSALERVSNLYESGRLPNERGEAGNMSDLSTPDLINRVVAQIRVAGRTTGLSAQKVERVIAKLREEMAKRESDLQGEQRPHFLETLWEKFPETRIENPDAAIYPLSVTTPHTRIEGNQFLARALIHYAYLHPTQTIEIVQNTERRELFYLIEHVIAQGIHDHERAHASDGFVGILHYVTFGHFRQQVINHAETKHQTRVAAIRALWDRFTGGSGDLNLDVAINSLDNEEYRDILRNQLHVPELERIFYITNSREQEEAYIRFANYTLRGQVNPEGTVAAALRSRFAPTNIESVRDLLFSPWQFRNSPAGRTVLDRLVQGTEHAAIYNQASASLRDSRGSGGDMNPLHWGYDFSDDEGSIDGLWDFTMQQVAIGGLLYGAGMGMRFLFGMGGPVNRFITGLEFVTGWRNHANPLARGSYWIARTLNFLPNLPLHRELSALEVEVVNDNAIRYARTTLWGSRAKSFFFNQGANLEASRLLFHRNPQEAAARVLRLSQRMIRTSEDVFTESSSALTRARNLSNQANLSPGQVGDIARELSQAADYSRQAYSLRELAISQRTPLGISVGDSTAFEAYNAELQQINDIVTTIRSNAGNGAAVETHLSSITTHLEHLKSTQTSMNGLSAYHRGLAARGALAAGGAAGLASLARLSENTAASRAAARMVDPAAILAQNPGAQGQWQLYLIAWQKLHNLTLTSEYRNIPSLREWALEQGLGGSEMSPDQLTQAYDAQQRYRGSRAIYRNAFLTATRELNERETIRDENLSLPTVTRTPGAN